ncbi:MAG: hypothetical protein JNM80_03870 [Phycisphaerae bacterium]|nr:hypothetical protein [Phycisphaerae bacterium]
MKNSRTIWSRLLVLAVAAMAVFLTPSRALAQDKLHLKNGTVLTGTIVREVNGYVWFKVKSGDLEQEQFFKPDEITKVERDASRPAEDAAPAAAPEQKPSSKPRVSAGAPRAAIITLGEGGDKDMVGLFMTAKTLRDAIPLLEADGVETVVFRINSGGGALLEIQKLSDVIHNEYKPKFRVVAWIESAISAAAMTAHCIEEIYFMPEGNYGACTGWFGALQAVQGRELEEVLHMMEKISARGKRDPAIMRSMQIMEPLSCSIDANGDVHWYNNLEGQHVVNPKERILTFDAVQAAKYGFSKGTARDIDELGKLLGYTEVEWVGKTIPGVPYPVSRAEELQRKFREQTLSDQNKTREYLIQYNTSLAAARAAAPEERGKFIGKCRDALDKIKRMVRNNPNMALFQLGIAPDRFKDWVDEREEELRALSRR